MWIIPAYAGSTGGYGGPLDRERDHPRIRGEHYHEGAPEDMEGRIIPAYAGSTSDVVPVVA